MVKLDVTIVKHYHNTAENFSQVAPMLNQFDVIALEEATLAERDARGIEEETRDFHIGRDARSIDIYLRETCPEKYREYATAARRYILTNQVPLIFAERFSGDALRKILQQRKLANTPPKFDPSDSFDTLAKTLWDYARAWNTYIATRDRVTANNIKNIVPERINVLYPQLASLDRPIRYGVLVGIEHAPEKYGGEVSVISVPIDYELEDHSNATCIGRIQREGGSIEDIEGYVARELLRGIVMTLLTCPETHEGKSEISEALRPFKNHAAEILELARGLTSYKRGTIQEEDQRNIARVLVRHGITKLLNDDLVKFLGGS